MPRITGFKIIRNNRGKPTHVQLSLKHHAKILEDMMDAVEMEKARNDVSVPWEEAKARLNKKFNFED